MKKPRAPAKKEAPKEREPVERASANPSEKLQKVLAAQGLGSRRTMEEWIAAGRIKVNGEPAHLGQRVAKQDRIQVDNGRPLRIRADHTRILILNKPAGQVCTRRDPEGRPTIFTGLPRLKQGRWISVGRLDVQTTGLLLLTNNGELANRMMHPSSGLDREYAVRVNGKLSDEAMAELQAGVMIEGELHRFSDIRYFDGRGVNHWYHVVLLEGKNREVRRLFESLGLMVSRLKRVRYGPVLLPSWLPIAQRAELVAADVAALLKLMRIEPDSSASGRTPRNSRRSEADKRSKDRSVLIDYPELPQRG
ncbi:MAG: pseudouridine synthase [Pseudomonadales bacterium]